MNRIYFIFFVICHLWVHMMLQMSYHSYSVLCSYLSVDLRNCSVSATLHDPGSLRAWKAELSQWLQAVTLLIISRKALTDTLSCTVAWQGASCHSSISGTSCVQSCHGKHFFKSSEQQAKQLSVANYINAGGHCGTEECYVCVEVVGWLDYDIILPVGAV